MPCWARESTSLIILVFPAVSSSSSFTRSRIGSVWRCTYFLRAHGFNLPQKPWRVSGCKGCFPVAPTVAEDVDEVWSMLDEAEADGAAWAADWSGEVELVC